ncbi:MAG TPA: hypothetical protein VFQ43_21765 [Nitrososphaera sp.]|nr:hypothetical protein [Nitrososphaera sp.]
MDQESIIHRDDFAMMQDQVGRRLLGWEIRAIQALVQTITVETLFIRTFLRWQSLGSNPINQTRSADF